MFGNIMGMLRKRRRVDGEPETSSNSQTHQAQSPSPHRNSASMLTDDECTSTSQEMQINESDSDLLVLSRRQLATIDRLKYENDIKYCVSLELSNKLESGKNSFARVARQNEQYNPSAQQQGAHFHYQQPQHQSPQQYQQLQLQQPQQQQLDKNQQLSGLLQAQYNLQRDHSEAMEIDSAPVPPPQEYSDSPFQQQHSESSMNFDYLSSLHSHSNAYSGSGVMDTSSSSSATTSSFRKGLDSSAAGTGYAYVDDRAVDRFVGVLDQLDARVEKFRKDALGLQEKKDFLLMSIDLIKTNDLLHGMSESEREEIACYIQRVNSRLSTVELNVRTVRDNSQEDSLSQINMLIDMMITLGDPVLSRQRCQQYLNACSSSDGSHMGHFPEEEISQDVVVDKKFESALLGCTLDDQKNIKKRLQALMGYLNKQTIRD